MDDDVLRRALDEAENELQRLDEQLIAYEKARARRDQIYGLVANLRFTLGLGPYLPPESNTGIANTSVQPPTGHMQMSGYAPTISIRKRAVWELVVDALSQTTHALTLEEIQKVLKGFNRPMDGRSGKESLRAMLHKKPDLFIKLPGGRYQLRKIVQGEEK